MAIVIVVLLFASVLTRFGRVTGKGMPEGMHLLNPFKSNTEASIRTQEIQESASVP